MPIGDVLHPLFTPSVAEPPSQEARFPAGAAQPLMTGHEGSSSTNFCLSIHILNRARAAPLVVAPPPIFERR